MEAETTELGPRLYNIECEELFTVNSELSGTHIQHKYKLRDTEPW
jgi:hypothetical protein